MHARMCTGQSNNVDGKKWDVYSLSIVFAYVFTGKEVLHLPPEHSLNHAERYFVEGCNCTQVWEYQSAITHCSPSCATPFTGVPRLD